MFVSTEPKAPMVSYNVSAKRRNDWTTTMKFMNFKKAGCVK